MKKLFVALTTVLSLAALLYLPAGADDESDVEVLVTPKVISILVDEDQLDYGSLQIGTIDNRPGPPGFRVTNDSTVPVDLQIMGANTVSDVDGSPGWTLAGAAGPDAYVHRYAVNLTSPTYPGEFGILTTTATDFMSDVLVNAFVDLKFALDMPTTTSTLDPQTSPLTVIALEATP